MRVGLAKQFHEGARGAVTNQKDSKEQARTKPRPCRQSRDGQDRVTHLVSHSLALPRLVVAED